MGTYPVASGTGGMYGLVFDNTFSKQFSKTATFVCLTYPSNAPPPATHHLPQGRVRAASSAAKMQSPRIDAAASESVDSLQSHLVTGNGASRGNSVAGIENGTAPYHVGVLQKRRRKRGQGYARRFFSLDFASCTLSYYYNRNSSALRGAIPLSLAAISADERRREISIDSGAEVWHLKAENAKDFDGWTIALEQASNTARGVAGSVLPPSKDGLRVRTAGLQTAAPNPDDDREWEQAEALVSRIVGTRDAVRRLSKDTAPEAKRKPHAGLSASPASPPLDENVDYFTPPERRSFWKRKPSSPSTAQLMQRNISAQLAFPAPTAVPAVAENSPLTPTPRKPRHSMSEEQSIHDHCAALLSDLDSVLLDFSTLFANHKRRRQVAPNSTSRNSIDSASTGEFYDAEAGDQSQSQILMVERRSEEDTQPSDGEDDFVSDASSISSVEEPIGAVALFPVRPKALEPLPITSAPRRRKAVPPASVSPPSLIGFLRKNVGKDLSTISMHASANEPLSLLQRMAEQLEYASLLDSAASNSTPSHRLLYVAAFAISQFSVYRAKERAIRKPFNPMLGETYELVRTEKETPGGFRLVMEKVSHRPVRIACQADSTNWNFSQSTAPGNKFWGKSAELTTDGRARIALRLRDGSEEFYSWNVATMFLRNVVMGEKYMEPVGGMTVTNETKGGTAAIEFKQKGMFGGRGEEVQVDATNPDGSDAGIGLSGTWTGALKMAGKEIWRVGDLVEDAPSRYGFTTFTAALNEITEIEKGKLPPTDSRLRPDQRAAEGGDFDRAETLKVRLEEAQRARRKTLEESKETYKPRWFAKTEGGVEGEEVWKLKSGKESYWEERIKGQWKDVQNILVA